ncbi:class I SAM-dependent methyltransferase [Mucilaginibacter sp. X5P1]|uniref:class I SAM-dependent methyltransferase n=1 Tax=Mucilaginibacter sp. X5P1 TaxID=2723088 RepID=UPI00160A0040|nr:class I SAM-dependent methyltransferase [Mucilaginibacter sp. X5P1]MBB6140269.1 SAM-dependent methyltransferase [Mucilaginibacter sp. X5P1]
MSSDSTKRFSDRVDNYIKFRPGYPPEVLAFLKQECKLNADSVIADVGAGTGIFTKLLLDEGYKVYAVEPNQPMRDAAVDQLSAYKTFAPIDGTAEATTLPTKCADLIVCAQAFHWFNDAKTKVEFNRILKDKGKAALIWNSRLTDVDEFAKAYEALLKHDGIDYNKVNHRKVRDIDFKAFFKDGIYKLTKYANTQIFDEAGLIGRAYSSSYVPKEDTVAGEKFLVLLKDIFNKYNVDGKVSFVYETEIYLGEV